MAIPVVGQFVAVFGDSPAQVRPGVDRVAGGEPGGREPPVLQQVEQPFGSHSAELAARE
ncbi:MAG: hypothetical protein OYL92_15565 [Acidobacteriota bacterium]|nr:hypothetical protein [Acidobacteriota bacterium]MDE3266386.1 hypothetical protein [Acidobacteriota bacterium]